MSDIFYSLLCMSEEAQDAELAEETELAHLYVRIGMVYAKKAARKGNRISFVFAPYGVHEEIEKELIKLGFTVSDYCRNFYDNPTEKAGYCIQW